MLSSYSIIVEDSSMTRGRPAGSLSQKSLDELSSILGEGRFNGVCRCGCGGKTPISVQTRRSRKGDLTQVKGYPADWVPGHQAKGKDSQMYTGVRHRYGYSSSYVPDHPRQVQGYVFDHILIMEKQLGRYLKYYGLNNAENEIVHHENEVKSDNSISNLELMTHREHSRIHAYKVDRGQVLSMLSSVKQGITQTEVASKYGVSRATVHDYVTGKRALPKH